MVFLDIFFYSLKILFHNQTGVAAFVLQPQIKKTGPTYDITELSGAPRQLAVLISRELYFDQHGKPITTSLKDHTKEIIKGQYASLDDFLNRWKASERKEAIIAELLEQGVMVEALYEAVDKQVDLFDLISHVAYDQPPLTRKERANNVKKRNYFTKYGDQAKKVLEALLDKYADQGIENIENIQILTVPPINAFGSVTEIIQAFGSREAYEKAIKELENELYKIAG